MLQKLPPPVQVDVFDVVQSLISSLLQVTWVDSKSNALYLPQTATLLKDATFPRDIKVALL